MAFSYSFDPISAVEYEEAFKWYNERSELAADNLILAFQQTIEAICNDPFRFRNNYKTYRELSLKISIRYCLFYR